MSEAARRGCLSYANAHDRPSRILACKRDIVVSHNNRYEKDKISLCPFSLLIPRSIFLSSCRSSLSLFFFFLFYFFFFLLGFFIFLLLHSVTSAFRGLYHESRQPVRFPCMFPQPSILLVNKVRRYYEASVYSCTVDPFLFIFFFWAKSDPVHLREGEGLF